MFKSNVVLESSPASPASVIMENSMSPAILASGVEAIVESISTLQLLPLVNLDQGDPTMYEPYRKDVGESFNFTFTMSEWESLSYFANPNNFCWFLMPRLEQQIKILNKLGGNAIVEGNHIVVGNGSNQLIEATLYPLADPLNQPNPVTMS